MTVWIPFLAADFGSIAGGWISSYRLKKGHAPVPTRKLIMLILALIMPVNIIAGITPSATICIIMACIAMAAHNGWIVNMVTLIMDTFPTKVVGTVMGLSGTGGHIGVVISAFIIGFIVDKTGTYIPVFIVFSIMHVLATLWVHLLLKKNRYKDI
jgi:ACS family hexuronate transporter-like MFS transporter